MHDNDVQSLASFGTIVRTQRGLTILVFHQYAHHSDNSCLQLKDNHVVVEDRLLALGGSQRLYTPSRYAIPLDVINGRFHLNSCPFTDVEWGTLPYVPMTRHDSWSPFLYDSEPSCDENWYSCIRAFQMRRLHGHVGTPTASVSGSASKPSDVCAWGDGPTAQTSAHSHQVKVMTTSECDPPCHSGAAKTTPNIPGGITRPTVDSGANSGIAGHEMRLISHDLPERTIDIEGFDHHVISKLRIGTHGAVGRTTQGEAILVFYY